MPDSRREGLILAPAEKSRIHPLQLQHNQKLRQSGIAENLAANFNDSQSAGGRHIEMAGNTLSYVTVREPAAGERSSFYTTLIVSVDFKRGDAKERIEVGDIVYAGQETRTISNHRIVNYEDFETVSELAFDLVEDHRELIEKPPEKGTVGAKSHMPAETFIEEQLQQIPPLKKLRSASTLARFAQKDEDGRREQAVDERLGEAVIDALGLGVGSSEPVEGVRAFVTEPESSIIHVVFPKSDGTQTDLEINSGVVVEAYARAHASDFGDSEQQIFSRIAVEDIAA